MSTKTFLTVAAVIGIVYALAFLIVPEALERLYGLAVNPSTTLEVRFFGTTLLGLALAALLIRDSKDRMALRGFLTAFAISNAVGVGVSAWGTYAGIMSQVGWSAIIIYALLLIGCFVSTPE